MVSRSRSGKNGFSGKYQLPEEDYKRDGDDNDHSEKLRKRRRRYHRHRRHRRPRISMEDASSSSRDSMLELEEGRGHSLRKKRKRGTNPMIAIGCCVGVFVLIALLMLGIILRNQATVPTPVVLPPSVPVQYVDSMLIYDQPLETRKTMRQSEYHKIMRPGDMTFHKTKGHKVSNPMWNYTFGLIFGLRSPFSHTGVVVFNPYYGEQYKTHKSWFIRKLWNEKYVVFHNTETHGNILQNINASNFCAKPGWYKFFQEKEILYSHFRVRRLQHRGTGKPREWSPPEISEMKRYVISQMGEHTKNVPGHVAKQRALYRSFNMSHDKNWKSGGSWGTKTVVNCLRKFNLLPPIENDGTKSKTYVDMLAIDLKRHIRAADPYVYSQPIKLTDLGKGF